MIAEWRRRKFGERVIYLCPTKQLVNQVVEQASDQYGLALTAFTGKKSEYSAADRAAYRQTERVAVTTYSSLFNSNPFFKDADLILIDDAHAAENYIAKIPAPDGWDRQGIGRRFFIFPALSLGDDEAARLRLDLMRLGGRSLVEVPSDRERSKIEAIVTSELGFPTFNAGDIEESKKPFTDAPKAVAIVANRYDGIDFPKRMWQADYAGAYQTALDVLELLNNNDLRGYRALWQYLAGSAALLAAADGDPGLGPKGRLHLQRCKETVGGTLPWLAALARYQGVEAPQSAPGEISLAKQVERFEEKLISLGVESDSKFNALEIRIREGLASSKAPQFEEAQKLLGELIGLRAGKIEGDATPDPWWSHERPWRHEYSA